MARKNAMDAVKSEADRYAANVLPIIREARKAGARTLREIAEVLTGAAKEATQAIPIGFLIKFADTALIRDTMSGASSSRTP